MAVGDTRLHGHFRHIAARHRRLRGRVRPRQAFHARDHRRAGELGAARLRASRFGRALAAIAGSEDAARALGIDVAHYKLAAFLVSAAYAALAGSLFVHVVEFVSPEVFGLHMVVLAFTMLYVGGIGTLGGPILAR